MVCDDKGSSDGVADGPKIDPGVQLCVELKAHDWAAQYLLSASPATCSQEMPLFLP